MRTADTFRSRAGKGSAAADLDRRTKQIMAANPGCGVEAARRAAIDEADAAALLAMASPADRAAAALDLRAAQLRAGNLDLHDAAVRDLARVQIDCGNADAVRGKAMYRG